MQHHLLRVTREAVNNAIKYSNAGAIRVMLATTAEKLQLSILDEGRGFDVKATSTLDGHFGIRGMKERARKIGADLQILSSAGKGTRVELALALPVPKA